MAEHWSPATYKQAVSAAKSFFSFLEDEGVVTSRLSTALVLPRVPENEQRTLSAEEIATLLKTAEQLEWPKREREKAIVALLTDSGLRASELCNITVEDIHEEALYVMVRGKGNSLAPALYGGLTAGYLSDWLEAREKWLEQRKSEDPGTVFVAIGGYTPGKPLTPRGLREILKKLGDLAGVPGVTPHAFRRAFATLMHEYGAPSRIAQVAGRWRDIRMVQRYTKELERKEKIPLLYRPYAPIDKIHENKKN